MPGTEARWCFHGKMYSCAILFYTVVPILIVVVCAGPGYKFYYQESKSGLYVIIMCMQWYKRQRANLSMHMYCYCTFNCSAKPGSCRTA